MSHLLFLYHMYEHLYGKYIDLVYNQRDNHLCNKIVLLLQLSIQLDIFFPYHMYEHLYDKSKDQFYNLLDILRVMSQHYLYNMNEHLIDNDNLLFQTHVVLANQKDIYSRCIHYPRRKDFLRNNNLFLHSPNFLSYICNQQLQNLDHIHLYNKILLLI